MLLLLLVLFFLTPRLLWLGVQTFGEWLPTSISFSIESSADDRPVIIFKQNTIDYSRHPFIGFNVYELNQSNPEYARPVWTIVERKVSNLPLKSLTYGICPPRFREVKSAEPLKIGRYYRVEASDVFRKLAPHQYEVIPRLQFEKDMRKGLIKSQNRTKKPQARSSMPELA